MAKNNKTNIMDLEKLIDTLRKILQFVISISYIFISLVSVLFIILLVSPILLLRLFVSQIAILNPSLSKLIPARSHNHAVDDIYSKPKCNIVHCTLLKGKVDIEVLRTYLEGKCLKATRPNGELTYVEAFQYPYQWMGFMFWKWEKNFDVYHHIRYYSVPGTQNGSKVSQAQLREIEYELVLKPFKEETSPWEALFIKNVESDSDSEEEHFMMILRFHHCMADGFSLMKLLFNVVFDKPPEISRLIAQSKFETPSGFDLYLNILKMIFIGIPQSVKHYLKTKDKNEWKIPESECSDRMLTSLSDKISVSQLKQIGALYNVGVSDVIFSAFTASVRKAMLKKNGKAPENIHCCIPFPIPGHPDDRLTNHASLAFLKLPVGENHPIRRLKATQNNLKKLKKSFVPVMAFYVSGLYGLLFPWITRALQKNIFTTAGATSFPGPKNTISIGGYEVTDSHLAIGSFPGTTVVMFTTFTYKESLRMKMSVNSSIMENQTEVDEMQNDFQEELRVLQTTNA